ncbi:hypothetical protein STAS_30733 [Striga asiatica]|uniref:Uncharacterized protein n=1 Tax=Striga asiatica TaxID=4170 RepID=A0A5A7R722_STRAF|nr:hypothetical protein STAS_30733 [Striga asiatica]
MAVRTRFVKAALGLMAICLAAYIVGPPLYWHLMEGLASASASATCPPCNCDCDSVPLLSIPQDNAYIYLLNFSDLVMPQFCKDGNLAALYYLTCLLITFVFFFLAGLNNSSFTDCAKHDPDVNDDTQKNFAELLSEELKLREAEALEHQQHADMALLEAKKMTSQYQKEADKCNSGMETCEEAREKSEAALLAQKQLTALWMSRARQRGWKEGNARAQS